MHPATVATDISHQPSGCKNTVIRHTTRWDELMTARLAKFDIIHGRQEVWKGLKETRR